MGNLLQPLSIPSSGAVSFHQLMGKGSDIISPLNLLERYSYQVVFDAIYRTKNAAALLVQDALSHILSHLGLTAGYTFYDFKITFKFKIVLKDPQQTATVYATNWRTKARITLCEGSIDLYKVYTAFQAACEAVETCVFETFTDGYPNCDVVECYSDADRTVMLEPWALFNAKELLAKRHQKAMHTENESGPGVVCFCTMCYRVDRILGIRCRFSHGAAVEVSDTLTPLKWYYSIRFPGGQQYGPQS
jgi:hypothetical protein